MPEFSGKITSGIQGASACWNWPEIKKRLNDENIYHGTINVQLSDYEAYTFISEINFPDHQQIDANQRKEGISFQRCHLRVGDETADAYVAKTETDFWGKCKTIEVISRVFHNAKAGERATVTFSN